MTQLPVVCTLTARELATRSSTLLADLFDKVEEQQEVANGVRLRFEVTSQTLQLITALIDAERQCCRFLQFEMTVEPDCGPIWLTLSGPPGTREFLDALVSPPGA